MANTKRELFQKRRQRVRNQLKKVAGDKLRLSVHRSSKNISAQIIDDARGVTVAAASTLERALGSMARTTSKPRPRSGHRRRTGERAGVEGVYFDRGGFLFHGKIKALADAAREGGLKF